jgi:hypothetical protein
MAFDFEELNPDTREFMWREFLQEEATASPYRGHLLTRAGREAWSDLMARAIQQEHEVWLTNQLARSDYWAATEAYVRSGVERERAVNLRQASERLASSEYNTWYVRGLAARLLAEGIEVCEVYRAAQPKWSPAECSLHEGLVVSVAEVYAGHRARYWPIPDERPFSIPFGPGCHHSIRRLSA